MLIRRLWLGLAMTAAYSSSAQDLQQQTPASAIPLRAMALKSLSSEKAKAFEQFLQRSAPTVLQSNGQVITPSDPSAFRIFQGDSNEFVVLRVPKTGQPAIAGDPQAVDRLMRQWEITNPSQLPNLTAPASSSLIRRVPSDWVQSINPDGVSEKLKQIPPSWLSQFPAAGAVTYPVGCPAAQQAFRPEAETLLDQNLAGSSIIAKRELLIQEATAFDQQCLASATSLPDEVTIRLAVLIDQKARPYCMAVRLRDDVFLSARHCLHSEPGKPPASTPSIAMARLALLTGPTVTYQVSEIADAALLEQAPEFTTNEDLVLIKAALPASGRALSPVRFSAPRPGAPLLIAGLYFFHDLGRLIPASVTANPLPPERWDQSLRITRSIGDPEMSYCKIFDWSDAPAPWTGCLLHACQTLGGYSGSPVFVRRSDGSGWDLVAIHSAQADPIRLSHCTGFKSGKQFGAIGPEGALAALIPASIKVAFAN